MNRLVYNERTEAIQFSKQPTSWCSVLQHVAMANQLHGLCFLLYFYLKYKESLLLNKKSPVSVRRYKRQGSSATYN